jgi:ADP-dependent NAD(P)H-hydrate dehydratase / NAD(P)H-hydrate epimerase
MKIFRIDQIKEIDSFTIANEPVSSVELMERAALKLCEWIERHFERSKRIVIFVGPGNNGGDGLALARLLSDERYRTEIYYVHYTDKVTNDWNINRIRLEKNGKVPFISLDKIDQFPVICSDDIIIDAIFGSGLKRPADGLAAEIIRQINKIDCTVIAVDIPSGLFGEDNSRNTPDNIMKADFTLSFQFPKLSFLLADNYLYVGEWHILPIGLHPAAIRDIGTPFYFTEEKDIAPLLKHRAKFDHKGMFGHGFLIAGSQSKTGAALLGAKAALRSGIGLITCHVPYGSGSVLQSSLPEAMVQPDNNQTVISQIENWEDFTAIGVGPGIGTGDETITAFHELLKNCDKPMVLDADAINILGLNKDWISLIRPGTILTPHPKEFERIAGKTADGYSRLLKQISFSIEHKCIIILKGAYTSISLSDGRVIFNSTGNPGMATAGSGDVLTGIVLSLLAQGYSQENASVTAVYIHGLAGDIAAEKSSFESVIASDIIENTGNAFKRIREWQTS